MNTVKTRLRGYTMIELLATLALVAVITAFAAPSFISQASFHQSKEVALTALATLKLCRSQALTSRRPVLCVIDASASNNFTAEMFLDVDGNGTQEKMVSNELAISSYLTGTDFTRLEATFNEFGYLEPDLSIPNLLTFCGLQSEVDPSDYTINLANSGYLTYSEVSGASC